MARENLPTNYVNYELATAMGGMRRFNQISNSDGTISFEDATTYSVTGTTYGASEINTANALINEINELVGTTSISGSGQTDITSLLGGTDITNATLGIGDGTVTGAISELNSKLSYVGMIIHSTKLSTLAQVQAIYGANTTWIQHSGYILRGATSGVVANSATKTGGNDGAWLMKHSHTVTITGSNNSYLAAYGTGNGNWGSGNNLRGDGSVTINDAGSVASTNTTANIPNYKSVYIWERTA